MPSRPLRPCPAPGCPERTPGGYCPAHAKARQRAQDQARGTAAQRGYNSHWRRARIAYLQQHPLCAQCQKDGRTTAANVVDHIVPHKGNMQLFWDRSNWQPLCAHHHAIKTAMEDGGYGHPVASKCNTAKLHQNATPPTKKHPPTG